MAETTKCWTGLGEVDESERHEHGFAVSIGYLPEGYQLFIAEDMCGCCGVYTLLYGQEQFYTDWNGGGRPNSYWTQEAAFWNIVEHAIQREIGKRRVIACAEKTS